LILLWSHWVLCQGFFQKCSKESNRYNYLNAMAKVKAFLSVLLIVVIVVSGLALTKNVRVINAQTYSDDWTMFHYNPAHTGYTPSRALTTTPVVLWSTPGQTGAAENSPAIANGIVYITSADLFAYNASTGEEIWNVSGAGWGANPTVNGDFVYCGGIAYNAFTGVELWSPNPAGARVAQAVADGYLYAQAYNASFPQVGAGVVALLCLNAATGAQIWRVPTNFIASDPAVANGMLYMGGSDGNLHAFNASTGWEVWKYPVSYVQANSLGASPTVHGGIVYTVSIDDNVYALNATDGTKVWNYTTGAFVESAPAVANGAVYVGSDDGNFYALNATDGTKIWNYTTSGGASSPAVADSVVYVGGFNGNLYALNASNGNKLWNFTLQQPPAGGLRLNGLFGSPAVVNGRVYIGSNANVLIVLGEASNPTPTPSPTFTPSPSPTGSTTQPTFTSFLTELVIAVAAIVIAAIAITAFWLRKRAQRNNTR
jgi:outer membrane protein assembly factor BamB